MNEPEVPVKKGWGWLQWGVVIGILFLMGYFTLFVYGCALTAAHQSKAASHAREIINAQHLYASDHDGHYSDDGLDLTKATANAAFRRLFQEALIEQERIFSYYDSQFMPNGDIGKAPDYKQALTAGENHWMMVAGMTQESPSHYPLVIENSLDAIWPPTWTTPRRLPVFAPEILGLTRMRGQVLSVGTTAIGFNDSSVQTVKLEEKGDHLHLPKSVMEPEGKTPLPVMKLLDIDDGS